MTSFGSLTIRWMFLDHDLTEAATMCDPDNTYEKTGTDIAKYIVREIDSFECPDLKIISHSLNPMGRINMVNILRKAGFDAKDAPFDGLKFDYP